MIPPLDIFKLEPDGKLMWKGTAADLGTAKLNVKALATKSPGDYMIFSQATGNRIFIASDPARFRIHRDFPGGSPLE